MSELSKYRSDKDEYFRHGHDSPLPHSRRAEFEGLAYYEEDPALRFEVRLGPGVPRVTASMEEE